MKSHISILITGCITLTSCALFSPYTTVQDEFKNTKSSTLELTEYPTELLSNVTKANLTFERLTTGTDETINVYFVIARTSSSFNLDKKCFIKADGKNYEITIENQGTEYKSTQESSSTSTTVKDSTKVKTELISKTNSYNWFDEKFVIKLTPEIKTSLLKTDELIFRFYLGPKQATFKLKGYTLKRVKRLFDI